MLGNEWLRPIFINRASRLFFLYLLNVIVYLPLSLFFPVWILILGPIIWSIPHIFSSLRYITRLFEKSTTSRFKISAFHLFLFVWLAAISIRIFSDRFHLEFYFKLNWPELLGLLASAIGLGILYKFNFWNLIKTTIITGAIVTFSWHFPIFTCKTPAP